MKLKEIIMLCNQMAGLGVPSECFDSDACYPEEKFVKLIACGNTVLEELYCDYATVLQTCFVTAQDNFVDCTQLSLNRVVSLTDVYGNNVPYRYTAGGLFVENGTYKLTYAVLPEQMEADSVVVLPSPRITPRIFAYGILFEYFLGEEDLALAKVWETRYRDALHSASLKTSSITMPCRRWIG